jgi:hypothetical protein
MRLAGLGGGRPTPFEVVGGSFGSPDGSSGTCCVALRTIQRGECVLFEQPCVVTRGEEFENGEFSDAPPAMQTDEWMLAYMLLVMGKGCEWAQNYVCTPRDTEIEAETAVAWVCKSTGATEKSVLAIFRAVANNAFALDSFILRIKYGAAFFELAAFLNHSCDPNCTSLRMGGNMAIFAARDIAKGEELSHSYIPSNLLLAEAQVRGKHLHFVCECQRCQRERSAERPCSVELAELGFPADHVKTASGKAVAAFKLACVLSDKYMHSADDCIRIMRAGDEVIQKSSWEFFAGHPIAAIEITAPVSRLQVQHLI